MHEKFKSISEISNSICSQLIEKEGIFSADIFLYWPDIVGGYSNMATPFKLTKVNDSNHLFITPTNECSILDLQYNSEIIKAKINTFFGKNVIQAIKIYQKY